jgi:hypothetical protein
MGKVNGCDGVCETEFTQAREKSAVFKQVTARALRSIELSGFSVGKNLLPISTQIKFQYAKSLLHISIH